MTYKAICQGAAAIPPSPIMLKHGNDYYTCSYCGEWCDAPIQEPQSANPSPSEGLLAVGGASRVNLCKGCGTMKHTDSDGLCGRCQPNDEALRTILTRLEHGGYLGFGGVDQAAHEVVDLFANPREDSADVEFLPAPVNNADDEAVSQWMLSLGLQSVPTDSGGYFNDGIYVGAKEAAFFYQATKAAVLAGQQEAEEYWRAYYGMASADEAPYAKLNSHQKRILIDYHTNQATALEAEQATLTGYKR